MDMAKKLQLRPAHDIDIIEPPASLQSMLKQLHSSPKSASEPAMLVFVLNTQALEEYRDQIVTTAMADHLTWVAYPKSGQLGTDLNRDTLASILSASGLQPVRQIAVDDVWSALRFRPGP
jgi:hypothetical protein